MSWHRSLKVNTLVKEVDQVMELLDGDNQSAWVLLSAAIYHQFDDALSLQYPSDVLDAVAATLDARLWSELEQVTGQHIPRTEEGLCIECEVGVPNVTELSGRSYQAWMLVATFLAVRI